MRTLQEREMSFAQLGSSLPSLIFFLVHPCSSSLYRRLGVFCGEPYCVGSLFFGILLVYDHVVLFRINGILFT